MSLRPNLKISCLNHPLMGLESCANSRRSSLCIGQKSAQRSLYHTRTCCKRTPIVCWSVLLLIQDFVQSEMIVVSDLADFNRIFLVTLKAHINKKILWANLVVLLDWFKLLSLWVILWILEEDCFGCCDDGLCRRDTATIKTLGQFGGRAQKAWEDLFIPHFTNVNWVYTTLCGIQKKPWTDKGKTSVDRITLEICTPLGG